MKACFSPHLFSQSCLKLSQRCFRLSQSCFKVVSKLLCRDLLTSEGLIDLLSTASGQQTGRCVSLAHPLKMATDYETNSSNLKRAIFSLLWLIGNVRILLIRCYFLHMSTFLSCGENILRGCLVAPDGRRSLATDLGAASFLPLTTLETTRLSLQVTTIRCNGYLVSHLAIHLGGLVTTAPCT